MRTCKWKVRRVQVKNVLKIDNSRLLIGAGIALVCVGRTLKYVVQRITIRGVTDDGSGLKSGLGFGGLAGVWESVEGRSGV